MSKFEDIQWERNAWGVAPIEVRNHTIDSLRWVGMSDRPGDVFIATWAKSGTTWVQQIVAQLVLGAGTKVAINKVSPWLENRIFPFREMWSNLKEQKHQRFVKTHLPANALPYRPDAKYIYVGRDGRDAFWSWHNHHARLRPEVYDVMRLLPGDCGPPMSLPAKDVRQGFLEWLARDGHPLWPFWSHIRSWWEIRHLPNVLLLHFDELKRDLVGSIHRIGKFIGIDHAAVNLPLIAHHCSFDYMKTNSEDLLPEYAAALAGGATNFIHRGEGGGWKDVLNAEDIGSYYTHVFANLDHECARWLVQPYGHMGHGDANQRSVEQRK